MLSGWGTVAPPQVGEEALHQPLTEICLQHLRKVAASSLSDRLSVALKIGGTWAVMTLLVRPLAEFTAHGWFTRVLTLDLEVTLGWLGCRMWIIAFVSYVLLSNLDPEVAHNMAENVAGTVPPSQCMGTEPVLCQHGWRSCQHAAVAPEDTLVQSNLGLEVACGWAGHTV